MWWRDAPTRPTSSSTDSPGKDGEREEERKEEGERERERGEKNRAREGVNKMQEKERYSL